MPWKADGGCSRRNTWPECRNVVTVAAITGGSTIFPAIAVGAAIAPGTARQRGRGGSSTRSPVGARRATSRSTTRTAVGGRATAAATSKRQRAAGVARPRRDGARSTALGTVRRNRRRSIAVSVAATSRRCRSVSAPRVTVRRMQSSPIAHAPRVFRDATTRRSPTVRCTQAVRRQRRSPLLGEHAHERIRTGVPQGSRRQACPPSPSQRPLDRPDVSAYEPHGVPHGGSRAVCSCRDLRVRRTEEDLCHLRGITTADTGMRSGGRLPDGDFPRGARASQHAPLGPHLRA